MPETSVVLGGPVAIVFWLEEDVAKTYQAVWTFDGDVFTLDVPALLPRPLWGNFATDYGTANFLHDILNVGSEFIEARKEEAGEAIKYHFRKTVLEAHRFRDRVATGQL